MRPVLVLSIVALAVALIGCAARTVMLNLNPIEGQRLTYSRGEPNVTSVQTHAVVLRLVTNAAIPGKSMEFALSVLNRSPAGVEVSTDNISASMNGVPLQVLASEEMLVEEQSRQSSQRIGLALQAFGAGVSGDPRQQALSRMDGDRFRSESQANIDRMERTLLRRQTVAPNTAYAGLVRIQLPAIIERPERVFIVVSLPPDQHRFAIELIPGPAR